MGCLWQAHEGLPSGPIDTNEKYLSPNPLLTWVASNGLRRAKTVWRIEWSGARQPLNPIVIDPRASYRGIQSPTFHNR